GGGIIGGILLACCYYLFSLVGTKIVAVFSMLIGIAFMTNASLGEMFVKVVHVFQSFIKKSKTTIQKSKRPKQNSITEEPVVVEIDDQPIQNEQLVIHEFSHKTAGTEENNVNEKSAHTTNDEQ